MTELTFITSNHIKLAHARHLCKEYDINVIQYKKLHYGIGYKEPRIYDRDELLKESIEDAIIRWKKHVSPSGNRFFFIEDTSVVIDALSKGGEEVPGVDVKYWMQDMAFTKLDAQLQENGNNRKVKVFSHVVLFLPKKLQEQINAPNEYAIFSSYSEGKVIEEEQEFNTNILYPWLDNKSFNKWFAPDGYLFPISMLSIEDADKVDFRRGAFEQMLDFLHKYKIVWKHSEKPISQTLNFNPKFIVCGPTCAGKSTAGRYLLERHKYFHIEASDFMTLRYFETHGTSFNVDKGEFAAEFLKINPTVVVNGLINYMRDKKINDQFVITGFRTPTEINAFRKYFSDNSMSLFYICANQNVRYNRWVKRQRDTIEYTKDRFTAINELQNKMGLSSITDIDGLIFIKNDYLKLSKFHTAIRKSMLNNVKALSIPDINKAKTIKRLGLEKAILIALAIEYQKNESAYYTTTEISHLINSFFVNFKKNKNNISRYFNQSFYPYYEIRKDENKKLKYKLSPTGYTEAIFLVESL